SLTAHDAILQGGDSGSAVDLKNIDASLLLKAVRQTDDLKMPPKGKLAAKDVETLSRWVSIGLPMPAGAVVKKEPKGGVVTEEARRYWAYQPVKRPATPAVKDTAEDKHPNHAF